VHAVPHFEEGVGVEGGYLNMANQKHYKCTVHGTRV
jgi:hypothetical protein